MTMAGNILLVRQFDRMDCPGTFLAPDAGGYNYFFVL